MSVFEEFKKSSEKNMQELNLALQKAYIEIEDLKEQIKKLKNQIR